MDFNSTPEHWDFRMQAEGKEGKKTQSNTFFNILNKLIKNNF